MGGVQSGTTSRFTRCGRRGPSGKPCRRRVPSSQGKRSSGETHPRCGGACGTSRRVGRVITHHQRSSRCAAAFPPHLPEAAASESSFAISTALSAPEDDQIPEGRRGMGRWPRTRQYEEHRPAGGYAVTLVIRSSNEHHFQPPLELRRPAPTFGLNSRRRGASKVRETSKLDARARTTMALLYRRLLALGLWRHIRSVEGALTTGAGGAHFTTRDNRAFLH